jgi:regulator of CtrA degradation
MMNDVQPQVSVPRPVSFAQSFVGSEAFRTLFREGMSLVEATAAYLDGEGREESKDLPRLAALAYASESMRLTTRLMQLASWLLLQRAVAEGELSSADAQRQKEKVRLSSQNGASSPEAIEALPAQLRVLIGGSLRLQGRILHLDRLMEGKFDDAPLAPNPVAMQQRLLQSAFRS